MTSNTSNSKKASVYVPEQPVHFKYVGEKQETKQDAYVPEDPIHFKHVRSGNVKKV
jgi:hypothetical protein